MPKKTINLIINLQEDTPLVKRLKLFLPLISLSSLIIFIILYAVSLIYIRSNFSNYNLLEKQTEVLEKKVSSVKSTEGIYTTTVGILNIISSLSVNTATIMPDIFLEVYNLQSPGVVVNNASIDQKGDVFMTVTTSNLDSLDTIIERLKEKEEFQKRFINTRSQGVTRDTDGVYKMNVTFQIKPQSGI